MLNRLPGQLPSLSLMLADIGQPSPKALAKPFGVPVSTAAEWIASGSAPLPVLLALFWLTRWGQSSVEADAVNHASMQASMTSALKTERDKARAQLAHVLGLADTGAANDPIYCGPPQLQSLPVHWRSIHCRSAGNWPIAQAAMTAPASTTTASRATLPALGS